MTLNSLLRKIERLGFTLQKIPNNKYHRAVNLKFFEHRGRFIVDKLPDNLKPKGSEDSVWLSSGYVIIGVDDYLGQIRAIKKLMELRENLEKLIYGRTNKRE